MQNKSIPSILSATLLIAILMAPLASADSGDETITVNHVVLVDTPPHPEWEWNYSYQTEVNDLQMNVSYTAVILIKQIGDDEWGGLDWWWDDIEGDGDQYNYTFSLQQGCYYINASLYESNDLNADEENATVLAFDSLNFTVGNADCGNEENDSSECLTFQNVTHDYNYSLPQQYTFNITAELYNTCDEDIIYPSTLILNDTAGVETSSDQNNWRYGIAANTGYDVAWEVTYSPFIPAGTIATFELHPTSDNCSVNCTESQDHSYPLFMALGPIDISTCYGIGNINHDYDVNDSHGSFNITAELDNNCPGSIHYPSGILWNNTVGVESSPPEGVENIGMSAYMIFPNTSTNVSWNINLDLSIANGTNVTFTIEPVCWVYTLNVQSISYMQDCFYTPLSSQNLMIQIGLLEPVNHTNNSTSDSDGDTILDNDDDCPNTPPGVPVDSHGCPEESIYIWPDDVGGYAGRAHNYSLTFNATMNSMVTLYEVDYLASTTTYLIEWYISNGSAPPYVAEGNLTTDSVNNTGYATPLHAALNLSDGCYAVWAELYDDTGQLLDDDEFTLCITTTTPSDGDSDGIPDSDDECPNTPTGTPVDSNGCPEEEGPESGNGSTDGGDVNNTTEEDESDDDADGGLIPSLIPGFGSVLGVSALLGAAFYRRRQN